MVQNSELCCGITIYFLDIMYLVFTPDRVYTTAAMDSLEPTKANDFLKASKRMRRGVGSRDNMVEECCREGCSFYEIAEYQC